jgi:hypothetical protein
MSGRKYELSDPARLAIEKIQEIRYLNCEI